MILMPESGTGMEESTTPQGNAEMSDGKPADHAPAVFLMTNSFETGGSERQFAALAQSLDPLSFRVDLGYIQSKGNFLEGVGEVAQFPLGGSFYGVQSIRARFRLGRHLRSSNIAIAHAFDFYTNLTLIPVARMVRVPVVIASQRQLDDLLSAAQFRAQLAIFRWCDAVVCNSKAAAESLVERGFPPSASPKRRPRCPGGLSSFASA